MATWYSQISGSWSNATTLWNDQAGGGGTWGIPVDGDSAIIQAGHSVEIDVDQSSWTGMAQLTIQGSGGTPAMAYFKYSADGTYYLKFRTGTNYGILGTSGTNKGRLLANSDGTWGNTGQMPFGRKCTLHFNGTASLDQQYVAVALYCTRPTYDRVRHYNNAYQVTSVSTANDTLTLSSNPGDGYAIRIASTGNVPGNLTDQCIYAIQNSSGNIIELRYNNVGTTNKIDITDVGSGTINVYTGRGSGTAVLNTVEDVSSDYWSTAAGYNVIATVNLTDRSGYDQQRTTLSSVTSSTITLGNTLDSVQQPLSYAILVGRNVQILSSYTASNQYAVKNGSGGVYDCEIRETTGTSTTFRNTAFYQVDGVTFNGVCCGFSTAFGTSTNIIMNGTIVCGIFAFSTCYGCTINGSIFAIANVFNSFYDSTINGEISGCTTAMNGYQCKFTSSAKMFSNSQGFSSSSYGNSIDTNLCCMDWPLDGERNVFYGKIFGCTYATRGTGHIIKAEIDGCTYAMYLLYNSDISGTIIRNRVGNTTFYRCTLTGNNSQLQNTSNVSFNVQNVLFYKPDIMLIDPKLEDGISKIGGVFAATYSFTNEIVTSVPGSPPGGVPSWCNRIYLNSISNRSDYPVVIDYPVFIKATDSFSMPVYIASPTYTPNGTNFTEIPKVQLVSYNGIADPGASPLFSQELSAVTTWQTININAEITTSGLYYVRIRTVGAASTTGNTLYWYPELPYLNASSGSGFGVPAIGGIF